MTGIVFGMTIYQEGERQLAVCLEKLRQAYREAVAFCISDGVHSPEYSRVCRQFGVDYTEDRRLKRLSCGVKWWDRFFRVGSRYDPSYLIKIDPDTIIHRPFHSFPGVDLFGTLDHRSREMEHIQGGCQGFRIDAVKRLLESGICQDPVYCDRAVWAPAECEFQGDYLSTDFTLIHMVKRLGLRFDDWDEVDCRYVSQLGSRSWKTDAAATHPRRVPRHEIECDWDVQAAFENKPFLDSSKGLEQWSESFNATGKTWLINIRRAPVRFDELCQLVELLTQRHLVSIDVNLTETDISDLARLDPANLLYLHAEVDFRRLKHGASSLMHNAASLRKSHHLVYVSVPMTPAACREYRPLYHRLAAERIFLLPKAFRGQHGSRTFPDEYSDAEREAVAQVWKRSEGWFRATFARLGGPPSIDLQLNCVSPSIGVSSIRSWLDENQPHVTMDANGNIRHLGSDAVVGNLLQRTVDFSDSSRHEVARTRSSSQSRASTVLLTWELGANLGHVMCLRPVAETLVGEGHRVVAAVKNVQRAREAFELDEVEYIQAPAEKLPYERGFREPWTFGHILYNMCFGETERATSRLRRWREIFDDVAPDLIVFDHSPTALLAARSHAVKRVVVGTGFCCPPPCNRFPNWRPWNPRTVEELERDEQQLLDRMNSLSTKLNSPPLSHPSDIYADADDTLLFTLPEFDHFPNRNNATYLGILSGAGQSKPAWPTSGEGKRIFAYLRPFDSLPAICKTLVRWKLPTVMYAPGLNPRLKQRFTADSLHFSELPVDLCHAADQCDIFIGYGSHFSTTTMLLAGKPVVSIPSWLEQFLFAQRLKELGLGRWVSSVN